jgi:sugar lactone lactonase YvrE
MLKELIKLQCIVGESPIWSNRDQSLYWIDIGKQTVYRYSQKSNEGAGKCDFVKLPFVFSAIFEGKEHTLYLVTEHGLALFDFDTGRHHSVFNSQEFDQEHRFNDAKVDTSGRLWVGSMNKQLTTASGKLYCLDQFHQLTQKDENYTVSNGIAWSPDHQFLYVVETVSRTLFQYTFSASNGEVSGKKILITFSEKEGKPDGITVDKSGDIWVAMWDGWAIRRLSATGETVETIELPVPRPTSVIFGGSQLETLFITTATYGLTPEEQEKSPYSGSLLSYTPNALGIPSNLFG